MISEKIFLKSCWKSQGFEVFDLGRDVPPDQFIDKAKEVGANLNGMSTLMTTTMKNMEVTIEKLKESRNSVIVLLIMVGVGPISHDFAMKIGADGYEAEASRAAETAKQLVMKKCYA